MPRRDESDNNEERHHHHERHERPHGPHGPYDHWEDFENRHYRGRDFWMEWLNRRRDYWMEYLDERDFDRARHLREHLGRAEHGFEDFQTGQPLSPKEVEAWREFFHQSFGAWPEDHWIFGGRRFSPWHQGMDSFNPFVATLLSKGGGLLPLYVLHMVSQKPRYGNEIMDILAERTNGQWVSNPGAIYPLLNQLEREGFIEGEWADPAKRSVRIYTITKTGQEELDRIKTIVGPKVEETIKVLEGLMQDLQGPPVEGGEPSTPAPEANEPQE